MPPLCIFPLRPAARETFSFAVVFASLCASGFIICFSRLHANIARCVCVRECVCGVWLTADAAHPATKKQFQGNSFSGRRPNTLFG